MKENPTSLVKQMQVEPSVGPDKCSQVANSGTFLGESLLVRIKNAGLEGHQQLVLEDRLPLYMEVSLNTPASCRVLLLIVSQTDAVLHSHSVFSERRSYWVGGGGTKRRRSRGLQQCLPLICDVNICKLLRAGEQTSPFRLNVASRCREPSGDSGFGLRKG